MCFRPASVEMPDPVCPECGKKLTMINGVVVKMCPFCKTDLLQYAESAGYRVATGTSTTGAPQSPGAAPVAPGAPKAPGIPSAPGAPKTPGAAKPPSASDI